MAELPKLTLAFLQRQPASAARALEALEPDDAAAVLGQVPVRISMPVFSAMTSINAARCAARLPSGIVAAVCETLPGTDASSLLRHLDDEDRNEVFARLPGKLARRFERAMDYSEGTVGAWLDLTVPAINQTRTVTEARRLLGQIKEYSASHLPLVNDMQKYVGMLPISALLRASPHARLETLASSDCPAVSDHSSLATVAARDVWDETTLLPVVNHRGELLGGLHRKTLSKALREQTSAEPASGGSVLGYLLSAYLVAVEGVLRLLISGADSALDSRPAQEP